jgi:hypothetical protein
VFFHIDKNFNPNFPCHWQLGEFHVSTDLGWTTTHHLGVKILYKGYADAAPLYSLLEDIICQRTPKLLGNFCVITQVDGSLQIQTDLYRSFPIYLDDHVINNLVCTTRVAWTDSLITMDRDFDVIENKFDAIGNIDISEISLDHALDRVHELLTNKTAQFLDHNRLPLKVFLSGGVDTTLVYSYLVAAGADFELLDYDHLEHDYFWRTNSHLITANWAYQQTHHWKTPCVLASGTPGDEFMLRSPESADFYLRHAGTSLNQSIHPAHMQHDYIKLEKNQQKLNNQPSLLLDQHNLHHHLCNVMVNDWQHWHLGNTLHWTPLRDLAILKIIMRLPLKDAIEQIVDNRFSQLLIERNLPGGSRLLSEQKNTGPTLKNLNDLFERSNLLTPR